MFLDGEHIGDVSKCAPPHDARGVLRQRTWWRAWPANGRWPFAPQLRRLDALGQLVKIRHAAMVETIRDAAHKLMCLSPIGADVSYFRAVARLSCADNLEACRGYLFEGAQWLGLVPRIRTSPEHMPEHLRGLWLAADELRIVGPLGELRDRARALLSRLGPPYDTTDRAAGCAESLIKFMRSSRFWMPEEDTLLESYLALLCEEIEGELIKLREGVTDAA